LLSITKLIPRFGGNRTGRAAAGLLTDYFGTAAATGIVFLTTPLLLDWLTPPLYGFWIAITQVMFWLNMIDGGAGIFLLKNIAKARETRDEASIRTLICTTFWSYVALGIITLVVGASLAKFVVGWIGIAPAGAGAAVVAFQVAVVNATIWVIILPCFYGVLQGYQQLPLVNGIAHGINILGTLTSLGLLRLGYGIEAMALGQLAATILGAIVTYIAARRACASISLAPRYASRTVLRQIFRFTGYFQMSKFSFVVSNFTDGLLIANALGPGAVAIYSLNQKLASTGSALLNKVGGAIMPGLAEIMASGDLPRLQAVVLRMVSLLARSSFFAMLLVATLNGRFVASWVGGTMFGGTVLTALFAYSLFRGGIIRNLAAFLFSAGSVRGWGWLSLLEGVANIGLTLLWLPRLGLAGAALATVAAESILTFYTPFRVSRLAQITLPKLLGAGVGLPMLWSLPTAAAMLLLNALLPAAWGWGAIALIAVGGMAINLASFEGRQLLREGKSVSRS
jgi:O-antigen/teichoic acid export membrane protein